MVNHNPRNPRNPREAVAWTVENIETLRMEHAKGLSCSQIAELIPGATRNAVIGKLHRLGLTDSRKACTAGEKRVKRPKRVKPAPGEIVTPKVRGRSVYNVAPLKPVEFPILEDVKFHNKAFLDLEDGDCHWPMGTEGSTQMYCAGATPKMGNGRWAVYCTRHHDMATTSARSSRPNSRYVVRRSKYA